VGSLKRCFGVAPGRRSAPGQLVDLQPALAALGLEMAHAPALRWLVQVAKSARSPGTADGACERSTAPLWRSPCFERSHAHAYHVGGSRRRSCYASPIRRARRFAEIMWEGRDTPLVCTDSLKEAYLGWLQGMKQGAPYPTLYPNLEGGLPGLAAGHEQGACAPAPPRALAAPAHAAARPLCPCALEDLIRQTLTLNLSRSPGAPRGRGGRRAARDYVPAVAREPGRVRHWRPLPRGRGLC